MTEVSFGNDGDFSDKAMIVKVNTNLANELGNLCQRTLSMVYKNCDKAVPKNVGPFTEHDQALLASAHEIREKASAEIAVQAIHKYVELMVRMVWETNKYIDQMEPWALKKTDPARMATVLYVILDVLRHVGILYQPLIPEAANKILDALSVPSDERTFAHLDDAFRIKEGSLIPKPEGIFPRIELPAEELVNLQG